MSKRDGVVLSFVVLPFVVLPLNVFSCLFLENIEQNLTLSSRMSAAADSIAAAEVGA
jgi:hypothetical protein